MIYENDNLIIPEEYKKMSVSELKAEKDKMLAEIMKNRIVKQSKINKCPSINFNYIMFLKD